MCCFWLYFTCSVIEPIERKLKFVLNISFTNLPVDLYRNENAVACKYMIEIEMSEKIERLFLCVLLQIEGLQRHPRYGARVERRAYRNMLDGLRQILISEGWHGLYKGIVPSTVKAAPAGAVTFVAYEFTSDWLESISW